MEIGKNATEKRINELEQREERRERKSRRNNIAIKGAK